MFFSTGSSCSRHIFPSTPSRLSNCYGLLYHTQNLSLQRPSRCEKRRYIGRRSACIIDQGADTSSNRVDLVATKAEKRHGGADAAIGKGKASRRSTGAKGNRRYLSRKGFDSLEDLMPLMTQTVTNPAEPEDALPLKHGGDSLATEIINSGSREGRHRSIWKKENGPFAKDDPKSGVLKGSSENVSSTSRMTQEERNIASTSRVTQKEKNIASNSRVTQEEDLVSSYVIPWNEGNGVASVSSSTDSTQKWDAGKPSLSGHQVMWALQQAALEKAKRKQKQAKGSGSKGIDREHRTKKAAASTEVRNWENARPIVIKPEWALQIKDLERRISELRNSRYTS